MNEQRVKKLKVILSNIKSKVDPKLSVKLDLENWERIIIRLDQFSDECDVCREQLNEVELHLSQLVDKNNDVTKSKIKENQQKISELESHLTKEHNLITSGYHTATYLALGSGFGLLFGLVIFDNIGLGLPIGMVIGMSIGAGLDNEAKKKGKTI